MRKLSEKDLAFVKKLYFQEKASMRQIADRLGISLDAVVYFMRRNNLPRRSLAESNRLKFDRKKPSFSEKPINSSEAAELRAIGAMLYWGEGYKSEKSSGIDFANSDPEMVKMFLRFLRSSYFLDEHRLRVLLYCYSDQNTNELKRFWSDLTGIPASQFTKPYIRDDYSKGRKMKYGLVHIRYSDKKLLFKVKEMIDYYKKKFF